VDVISKLITHPGKRPKPGPQYDPQRERVYAMEREIIGMCVHHSAKRADLIGIVEHACKYYGVPVPRLVITNRPDKTVFGWTDHKKIVLNRGYHGANTPTLLHELAHWIVDQFDPLHIEAHRPQFVGVYMHMLEKYRLMPEAGFRSLAKKYKVRVSSKFLPEDLRAWAKRNSSA
jgi:hypothetical protein